MTAAAVVATHQHSTLRTVWSVAIVAALLSGVVLGATKLSFLCDDAFITFRHVSNAVDGHGLVWNAPPFLPVEGCTGFAWALLLWAFWSWFGLEPPAVANGLSIGFGCLSFLLISVVVFRLRRSADSTVSIGVAVTALAVLASNRTYLQWMTGGLETALFNLAVVGWVLLAFRRADRRTTGWLWLWSSVAALAALTRPDGLLLVAATAAAAALGWWRRQRLAGGTVIGSSPLLVVLAHGLWRRWFYGEWLPNTYYAKVTAAWPEAGWRYLYCFAFEHGLWLWGILALVWLPLAVARRRGALAALWTDHLPAAAAVATVISHVGYYTLRVGGDHFEYRVFSHLVPLMVVSAAAMLLQIFRRSCFAVGSLLCLGLAGAVGWLPWALTNSHPGPGYDSLSSKLPAWVRPVTRNYDRHQAWLQMQFNCMRCTAHQQALDAILTMLPARTRTRPDAEDVPITMSLAVGLVGWVLPDVAVIDLLGLCDWVTARTPTTGDNAPYLPKEVLRAAIAAADQDHDGFCSATELRAAFTAAPGFTPANASGFVDLMLLLFAYESDDGLTSREVASLEPFFANLRWIAHERAAPPDYVAALDPNVTIENRSIVVRRRGELLSADRLRALETGWRARVRRELTGR